MMYIINNDCQYKEHVVAAMHSTALARFVEIEVDRFINRPGPQACHTLNRRIA